MNPNENLINLRQTQGKGMLREGRAVCLFLIQVDGFAVKDTLSERGQSGPKCG
jgi:hypothetical protein